MYHRNCYCQKSDINTCKEFVVDHFLQYIELKSNVLAMNSDDSTVL